MNPRSLWPAVVLASVGAIVGCVMAIFKVPSDVIALVASLMIVPVLTAMVTGQISELRGTTSQLTTQTNGNWSKMIELLAQAQPSPNTGVKPEEPPSTVGISHGSEGS